MRFGFLDRSRIYLLLSIWFCFLFGGLFFAVMGFNFSGVFDESSVGRSERVYTPLELLGRDIYIREGCHQCHNQLVRSLGAEVDRYGRASVGFERGYVFPTQFGFGRIGRDLSWLGGQYSDEWLISYLSSPFGSGRAFRLMPSYSYLLDRAVFTEDISVYLGAIGLGGGYDADKVSMGLLDFSAQSGGGDFASFRSRYGDIIVHNFLSDGFVSEMEALVSYLQVLGLDYGLE